MKIIISESQLSLLKEESISNMGLEELYNRALKLKKVIYKNVVKELKDYLWFDELQISIERDWVGLPYFFFNIKTNLTISQDNFYNQKLSDEIHDKIENIFIHYFPDVNKNTKYALTGVWDSYITDIHGYSIHI